MFDIFTTTDTSGRPAVLAGNPPIVLVVYRNAFVDSCSTVGATLALNCNGLTGVNAWSVNTELDKGFYACASQYQVLLRGGCVDSICVSGYVVGRFSLAKTATLRPQIAGRNCVGVTASGKIEVDPCAAIFSVQRVVDRVLTDECSAIFSVRSVLNAVTPTACSTVYEVITISNSGVAKILDTAITQPTAVFAWSAATLRNVVGWLGALGSNCVRQTATVQTLRARDDLSAIATANVTCEAATVHRGSFT